MPEVKQEWLSDDSAGGGPILNCYTTGITFLLKKGRDWATLSMAPKVG